MTITFATETSGLCPEIDHGEKNRRPGVQSNRIDGPVLRRQLNARDVEVFDLRWTNAPEGQAYELRRLFDESLGGTLSGLYTPIGDIDVNARTVVMVAGTMTSERKGPDSYVLAVTLEEVH